MKTEKKIMFPIKGLL